MGNRADRNAALCFEDFGENDEFDLKHTISSSTQVNKADDVNFKWSFRQLKIDFLIALMMVCCRSPPNLHEF